VDPDPVLHGSAFNVALWIRRQDHLLKKLVPGAENHYNDDEILLGTFAREISYFLCNVFTFCEISLSLTKFRYFRQFFIFLRHFISLDEISLS
jgi:hypothetical protein